MTRADRPSTRKLGIVVFFIFFLLLAQLLPSCGRKGEPTLKAFEKPQPVQALYALHREDAIILSWSYPSSQREKVKAFYVEKAESDEKEKTTNAQGFRRVASLGVDASTFVDRDFRTGRQYQYKVRAMSLRDVLSDDSPVLKVTPQDVPLPPTGLSYAITADALEIRWNAMATVKYDIYKSYERGNYAAPPLNRTPLEEPRYKDRIELLKPVYYAVRGLRATEIRDEGPLSENLEVDPGLFRPSAPKDLGYVVVDESVYLIWNNNPEGWIQGYRIYRKRASEHEFHAVGKAPVPAFKDEEGLGEPTSYYVTAMGPKAESSPSAFVEVHPLEEQ